MRAATRVFEEMGFGGTRMEDIARAAGTSRALVYRYFDSKQDLFVEIGRECAVAFDQVIAAAKGVPIRYQDVDIDRFTTTYLEYLDQYGPVVAIWSQATWNAPELRSLGLKTHVRNLRALGRELARIRGSSPIPPLHDGVAVIGILDRFWYLARVGGAPLSHTELVETARFAITQLLQPAE